TRPRGACATDRRTRGATSTRSRRHEEALLVVSVLDDRGGDGRPDAPAPDLPQGDGVAGPPTHLTRRGSRTRARPSPTTPVRGRGSPRSPSASARPPPRPSSPRG